MVDSHGQDYAQGNVANDKVRDERTEFLIPDTLTISAIWCSLYERRFKGKKKMRNNY